MRTLLVVSQTGGVGATTVAVNLAAAAASGGSRVLLLDADPERPALESLNLAGDPPPDPAVGYGGVWSDAPGGFDAGTPYRGPGTDDDLTAALESLKTRGPESWDLVVIDAPPGGGPDALLFAADELLLVACADKGHFRALPTYLEAIRAARRAGSRVGVRGILMTLPAGVAPGGPVEAALRQKFKGLLPQVIPADPAVEAAAAAGRPVLCASPSAPSSRQFVAVAKALKLVEARKPEMAAVASRDDSGIFDMPPSRGVEKPLSGKTETFYPDRRRAPGKGPELALPAATPAPRGKLARPGRQRLSPLEVAILAGSGVAAVAAAIWFCLG